MFQQGCLILDLREGQGAYSRAAPRVDGVTVPLEFVGRRPVLRVGGAVDLRALFDTGTSALGLVCRPELFREIAGEGGNEGGNEGDVWALPVTVIGGVGELHGARVELDLAVGGAAYESTNGRIEALVGNELFRDRIVVVDFVKGRLVVGAPGEPSGVR